MRKFYYFILFFLIISKNISSSSLLDIEDDMPEQKQEYLDPLEDYNRKIYNYNVNYFNKINPFISWYATWPIELRWTMQTLYKNYNNQIFYMFYNLIDCDLEGFLLSFWKFYINIIFGFGGLYDVADKLEIPLAEKSLDDIFYKFGIVNVPYFILPISGSGTVFKAFSFVIENTIRIVSGLPMILHIMNAPNTILDDIEFMKISGDFPKYENYRKMFLTRFLNERERNLRNRNNRLKLINPCDNKATLEVCEFENEDIL